MPNPNPADVDCVKSVDTAFRILEHLEREDGARVTEVADALDVAKSTAHRHLKTLQHIEYLVKEGDTYRLGLRFLELGEYISTREKAYVLAHKKVKELAEETDERAQFLVEEHGRLVYVHRETGRHAVETDPGIGKRVDIHASSAGKAILAHLPDHRIDEIISQHGLPQFTEHTITDPDDLFAALETIRERGYAFNDEESIDGLRAVGVPVLSNDGVVGALSVSGPTHRLKNDWFTNEIPDLLLGITNELELNLKYS